MILSQSEIEEIKAMVKALIQVHQKLAIAVEALQFYADTEEWIDYKSYNLPLQDQSKRVESKFDQDPASKAIEALKAIQSEM